jgi:hypothetical protein
VRCGPAEIGQDAIPDVSRPARGPNLLNGIQPLGASLRQTRQAGRHREEDKRIE